MSKSSHDIISSWKNLIEKLFSLIIANVLLWSIVNDSYFIFYVLTDKLCLADQNILLGPVQFYIVLNDEFKGQNEWSFRDWIALKAVFHITDVSWRAYDEVLVAVL